MAAMMMGLANDGNYCLENKEMDYEVDMDDQDDDEEGDFSDPEGFVDDVDDEELLGDVLAQRPKETDGFENVIIVDGIPQVGQDRLEKLQNVIRKIYGKFGKIVNEYFPEENGKTKGYIFLEYSNAANALEAVSTTNGYKLDKQHTFSVNLFTDFDRYMNIPDKWENPEPQSYKNPGNLQSWLQDPDCYDQYCMVHAGGDKTSIYLNSIPEPKLVEERTRWTETYVRWSPLGTYLCTFHQRGIALWGGEKFKQIMKFSHPGVQFIDFTPRETYLVTFSPQPGSKEDPQSIIIWDLRTGQEKRRFHCEQPPAVWPIFKWSHDDKYFARVGSESTISIYETPGFGLMDKKSMKITGLKDFTWSPADNIITYWVAESKNVPARVILMEIPSRNELQSKNLFNVADCKMHWQKTGDYLAVKVDRYTRAKREKNEIKYSGLYYNFEIFHMREKQIPVDIIEIKEPIVAFAWDPVGPCCAIVHGETPNISVSFYGVKKRSVSLIKKYEKKACNHVFWSPQGQYIVLAGLRSMNGVFEFLDTKEWQVLGVGEHYSATDVEWDPTGRYLVTALSFWAHTVDNAFYLWSWQGRIIQRNPIAKFCQLLWRPRPPTLLGNEQIQEIKKNLKKYSVRFEAKDRQSLSKASKELLEKRKALLKDFEKYREEQVEIWEGQKKRRLELRNNIDTDNFNTGENMDEEVVEFFIKEEVTVID